MRKIIMVTGGVMSGIGKGITSASIGKLFQFRGFKVSIIKIDPYLNIDPGTLNPIEHGECFITEEVFEFNPLQIENCGPFTSTRIAELDQDFGTYERFLGVDIHPSHNITSGQIYLSTILKERHGEYLGKTVQIIPHCTNEIKNRIKKIAEDEELDVLIIECGGTVGDLESIIFLEAFRQLRLELNKEDTALIHVTMVPYSHTIGELKSKPTQHSVKSLLSAGLQADVIICRSEIELTDHVKEKISMFSNVPKTAVISNPDAKSIYQVPLSFEKQKLGDYLSNLLRLTPKLIEFSDITNYTSWEKMVASYLSEKPRMIKIGMPGKYMEIRDSYVSILEAFNHCEAKTQTKIQIIFIDTEKPNFRELVKSCDGILLTPGFGSRGVEWMIESATIALEDKIPYLGICFGSQLLFVAFMRKYMGYSDANSTEIDANTTHPVVSMMDEQKNVIAKGGTMRLGAHEIKIVEGTKLYEAYKSKTIKERFRHRYHIVESYIDEKAKQLGMKVSSRDESGKIVNSIEIDGDNWVVGTQFHPEYKSRPWNPSPIYLSFVQAVIKKKYKHDL